MDDLDLQHAIEASFLSHQQSVVAAKRRRLEESDRDLARALTASRQEYAHQQVTTHLDQEARTLF